MKFPYELSEQRLSLLSKEDLALYRYEHSDYYSYTAKMNGIKEYQKALLERQGYYFEQIDEDEEYDEMNEAEKKEMAKLIALVEADVYTEDLFEIFEEAINDGSISEEEFELAKNILLEYLHKAANNELSELELNEAEEMNEAGINIFSAGEMGKDEYYWLLDAGWIGKLALAGLGSIFGGILSLIMAGKDKMAMKMLEKYMNKLVEKVDDGTHKKKSFLARLFKRDKYEGDQTKSCLRRILETFQSQIATDTMVLVKNCGFLPSNLNGALNDMENNTFRNGGMELFLLNIGYPLARLSRYTKTTKLPED